MKHAAVIVIVAVSLAFIAVSAAIVGGRDVKQEPPARYQLLSHGGALWMLDQTTGDLYRVSPAVHSAAAQVSQRRSVNVRWLPWKRPPITITIPRQTPQTP